ncbi:MAG: tetratricopeptide repeat protein [Sporichthyaceae bacterium]|nr:tetratricopeptide repeat protein [Sporichthyaceae bacterium]
MAVEFGLLGDIEMRVDGRLVDIGHARQTAVLAALLIEPNRAVPLDHLLDRIWGDRPPQRARGTLYSYLSRLRHILAAAEGLDIVRQPGGYLLPVDSAAIDLQRFRQLVVQARTSADAAQAAALLDQALGLWRGDAFATLDTPWLNTVRTGLDRERLAAELDRNDLALARGAYAELVGPLEASAAVYPLDERLAGQLMLALYGCGRQAAALEHYQQVRRRLADELGIDPGPALRTLHQQILTSDTSLASSDRGGPAPVAGSARTAPPAAAHAGAPVPRQLPAPPRAFTGRDRELAALTHALDAPPDQQAAVVISAIGGAGGMGKTWLAVRWAHDHLDRFPDGQLYVDLRGFDPASEPVPPAVAVRGFLDALGVDRAATPVDVDAQAALYRSIVADRRMLVVLDNARDSAQVIPLLPGTASCAVLVTSRHQLTTLISGHGARPLPLDVLTETDARQLLTAQLGADRVAAEPAEVDAVLEHCAGLPLALGIVSARAAVRPDRPLAGLAGELQHASTRLDALDAGELAVNLRAGLTCSYQALPADQASVFRLLGLMPGPEISLPAAVSLAALPAARVRILLRELVGAHLVHEPQPGRFRLHDLVRLYAAEQARGLDSGGLDSGGLDSGGLDSAGGHAPGELRILDHYLHTAHAAAVLLNPQRPPIPVGQPVAGVSIEPLADHSEAMTWFDTERLVLLAAIARAFENGHDRHVWQLAWTVAEFLDRRGYWHERASTQQAGLDAARRAGDRAGQAHSSRGLGGAYAVLGRFEESDAQLLRAIDLFAELGDHVGQAAANLDLAGAFERRGRHRDALTHTQQAHDLFALAGYRTGQANALNGIGWLHSELGDQDQALASCQRALELLQAIGYRRGEAMTWDSLGYIHHQLGQLEQAESCLQQALAGYRALGDQFREAESLSHLGDVHRAAGQPDAARQCWQRSLAILDQLGHSTADGVRAKLDGST